MRDFRDAKVMAKSLRQGLSQREIEIGHSEALELIAKAFGYDNWNILAAKIEAAAPEPAAEPARPQDGTLYCSFCSKSQHEVAKLIAGPASFICNECVALCNNVIEETDVDARIAEDQAKGDAGWSALTAYMRDKTDAQLQAYVAAGEPYLASVRKSMRQSAGKEPYALRYMAERLKGMSPDERAKLVAHLSQRAERIEIGLEAARRVLAERGG